LSEFSAKNTSRTQSIKEVLSYTQKQMTIKYEQLSSKVFCKCFYQHLLIYFRPCNQQKLAIKGTNNYRKRQKVAIWYSHTCRSREKNTRVYGCKICSKLFMFFMPEVHKASSHQDIFCILTTKRHEYKHK